MFAFIKNFFLKKKAKKILLYIEKTEISLTLFQLIDNDRKNETLIRSLSKSELFSDVVSRYNVCIQKIEKHNVEIQSLTCAYNKILQTYHIP